MPEVATARDDWALLRGARSGDAEAWEELWRRHRERVFRVALAVTRERESAQDVAQSVLLRLVDGRPPSREEDLGRYLAVAAWREAVRLELAAKHKQPLESAADSAGEPAPLEEQERREAALEAIERLPAAQRDTLALRLVGGLSYEETAHVLGVPLGTVRSRLHTGIRACREMLRKGGRLG